MKKIAVGIVYFIFFLFAFIYFVPKSDIYHLVEDRLKSYEVIIDGENLDESGFTLKIMDAKVYFDSIESAKISNMKLSVFGFYNLVSISDIELADIAKAFIPLHIDSLDIKYFIFNPFCITAHGMGEFGDAKIDFNIVKNTLHMVLNPSKKMLKHYRATLKNLKKSKDGEFVYDKTF